MKRALYGWGSKQIFDKEEICFQGFKEEDKNMIINYLSCIHTNLENQLS